MLSLAIYKIEVDSLQWGSHFANIKLKHFNFFLNYDGFVAFYPLRPNVRFKSQDKIRCLKSRAERRFSKFL